MIYVYAILIVLAAIAYVVLAAISATWASEQREIQWKRILGYIPAAILIGTGLVSLILAIAQLLQGVAA